MDIDLRWDRPLLHWGGYSHMTAPILSVVVPCYNEEEVLRLTCATLSEILSELKSDGLVSPESRLCFVDDGSRDGTWTIIASLAESLTHVVGVKLSRNFGHQSAMLAGLFGQGGADCVVTVDADLQDDVTVIRKMVEAFKGGADIVYGVRDSRAADTIFKRATAESFYKFLRMLGAEVVQNHADFRLLSHRAIKALEEYREVNLFVRGIVPLLGFRTAIVTYQRKARAAGESKYPVRKMISLAVKGITSLSVAPLRAIVGLGVIISVASFAVGAWAIYVALTNPEAVPGWASTVVPLYFLGGVQLLCLGVIGEYVAKSYIEAKRRPRYQIEEIVGNVR